MKEALVWASMNSEGLAGICVVVAEFRSLFLVPFSFFCACLLVHQFRNARHSRRMRRR